MLSIDKNNYNRLSNLDGASDRIVEFLIKSRSKYADYLWRILQYDTEDCLSCSIKDEKTGRILDINNDDDFEIIKKQRRKLLYVNNGDASVKRVFLSPYIDDAWDVQSSHLHIYVSSVVPQNHLTAVVNIGIECITHNKISNIVGDASELNVNHNPSELDENGDPIVRYKSRTEVMLKSVVADLNGSFVAGVGMLQFNSQLSGYDNAKLTLWNNRKFFGYQITMSTLMSGVSDDNNCGY